MSEEKDIFSEASFTAIEPTAIAPTLNEQGQTKDATPKAPVTAMWIVMVLAWIFLLVPFPLTGILIGWPLDLAAIVLAIICLTRDRVTQGVIGLIGTLVVSTFLFFVGSILMVAMLATMGDQKSLLNKQQYQHQQQQQHQQLRSESAHEILISREIDTRAVDTKA
ncbi:MAG: hypothetical protein FWF41_08555 [Betaproteobacteria bacterium]|nr:hypothetical protein [Betaproteobacteria bacterium]